MTNKDLEMALLEQANNDDKKEDDLGIPFSLKTWSQKVCFLLAYLTTGFMGFGIYLHAYNANVYQADEKEYALGDSVAGDYNYSILILSRIFIVINAIFYASYVIWCGLTAAMEEEELLENTANFVSLLHLLVEIFTWASIVWLIIGGAVIWCLHFLFSYFLMWSNLSMNDVWNLHMN